MYLHSQQLVEVHQKTGGVMRDHCKHDIRFVACSTGILNCVNALFQWDGSALT